MNVAELKGKIVSKGFTTEGFCQKVGIVRATFDRKMSGKSQFCRDEIVRIIRALDLNMNDVYDIFFADVVS